MRLRYLIQKEFIQIRRNAFLPRMIVIFPIALICIAPWITNMEVKNINVCLVDNDHSQTSAQLAHRIEQSNYFIFKGMASSYTEAHRQLEKNDVDVIAVENLQERTHQNISANLNVKTLYNKMQDYKVFMIPGLMAILLVLMCGFMPALNIVGEKEAGTIEQVNVTPVSKWEFILAKLIPYWIIGLFVLTVCMLLSWLIYDITPTGNILLIYLDAMLLALIMSGLGLIISNYSDQMMQAMLVMWFIMVCFILLSGLFTPVQSMPQWAQTLTLINPMRHFIDAMRTVFVRGGVFMSIWPQILTLAVFAIIINTWAVISYKKNS